MEFFEEIDNSYRNSRCDVEIASYKEKVAFNQRVGRLGGRPRGNPSETRTVTETVSENNPSHTPVAKSQEPEESKSKSISTPLASSPNGLSAGVNGKSVAYIPLVDGTEFGLSEGDLDELKKAYPALDCKQTMLEIRAWCVANPTRKKTRRGAMRFINSWMARLQDRAR